MLNIELLPTAPSADELLNQDRVLLRLRELIRENPDMARAEGQRLLALMKAESESPQPIPSGLESVPANEVLGLYLGEELKRVLAHAPEALRTTTDWWEVAVMVALFEDPETRLEALGMEGVLQTGKWREEKPVTFDHREGLRAYADLDPELDEQGVQVRRRRLWSLAARALGHLEAAHARRPSPVREHGVQAPHQGSDRVVAAKDHSWLRVGTKVFSFGSASQRAIIEVLHQSWTRAGETDGCGLSLVELGEQAGLAADRVRIGRTFAKNPALNTLLKESGRGQWALYINEILEAQ